MAVTSAPPLFVPQLVVKELTEENEIATGSTIVAAVIILQLFASVMVTEYVPADRLPSEIVLNGVLPLVELLQV